MPKAGEKTYLQMQGDPGREHNLTKPFSDAYCGPNLAAIGTIIELLPSPPASILDMGCGAGWTSIFLARRGFTVLGQDISEDMIDLARDNQVRQLVGNNLSFTSADFEAGEIDGQFDAVIFFDCLHHAEDERSAIASAYRALRPGGVMITHEPGEGHALAPGSIEAMELFGVTEKDMPPHHIVDLGRGAGFISYRISPMQHELIDIFYLRPIPRLLSKAGWRRAKRVLRLAFRPSDRASSIVVMTK